VRKMSQEEYKCPYFMHMEMCPRFNGWEGNPVCSRDYGVVCKEDEENEN